MRLGRVFGSREDSEEELSPEEVALASSKPAGRIGTSAPGPHEKVFSDHGERHASHLLPSGRKISRSPTRRRAWRAAAVVVAAAIVGGVVYFETARHPQNRDRPFVRAAYEHLLGRAPDSQGYSLWETKLARGTTRTQVAYDITTSTEFRADLVDSYYKTYLGHPANAAAVASWGGELAGGASDQTVQEGILGSQEFYLDSGATPGSFIDALYEKLLGRGPNGAERAAFEAELSSNPSPTRDAIAAEVLDSNEYHVDFVDAYFRYLLGHPPDNADLNYWVFRLAGGGSCESVIAGIVGPAEFYTLNT